VSEQQLERQSKPDLNAMFSSCTAQIADHGERFAAVQGSDLGLLDIDSGDVETGASKCDGEGHADIPQSHHANMSGVSIFSFSS